MFFSTLAIVYGLPATNAPAGAVTTNCVTPGTIFITSVALLTVLASGDLLYLAPH